MSDKYLVLISKGKPMPANYVPELSAIYGSFLMERNAAVFMKRMLSRANSDGIRLKIISAYRSVEYQKMLFDKGVKERIESGMSYEEAYADTSINLALPGESEHNSGLAADIVTMEDYDVDESFAKTEEFSWLSRNAADFGYILRYPEGKKHITGYIYEPWHYRFVGVNNARKITLSGLTLEEYLTCECG